MAATQTLSRPIRWARSPFYFNSSAQLIRIGRQRATTLGEFADMLQSCPDELPARTVLERRDAFILSQHPAPSCTPRLGKISFPSKKFVCVQ